MTDFKAKLHQIRFRLGLSPRPRWGAYLLARLAVFGGPLRGRGRVVGEEEGNGREGEVEGREREGPKLPLNQGPSSEPCYTPLVSRCQNVSILEFIEAKDDGGGER